MNDEPNDSVMAVAHDFRKQVDIHDPDAQFKCVVEEIGELSEALNTGSHDAIEEEIGDIIVTVAVLADLYGVDAIDSYYDQMADNMEKSPSKKGGKVTKA